MGREQGQGSYIEARGPRFLDAEKCISQKLWSEGSPHVLGNPFGVIFVDEWEWVRTMCGKISVVVEVELAGAEARSHCAAYGALKPRPFKTSYSRVFFRSL